MFALQDTLLLIMYIAALILCFLDVMSCMEMASITLVLQQDK